MDAFPLNGLAMRLGLVFLLGLLPGTVAGQVISPPPPARYHVDLRYRIAADRDGRARTFRAMMAELNALGFKPDDREDADLDILDPNADRLSGTISSEAAGKLLNVTAVQTVLVRPAESALPDDIAKPVQLAITLAAGLDPETQRRLHEQVTAQLEKLGFKPALGYDDRDFTRVRGSIAAGQVFTLLKDLRGLPAGWLLAETPRVKLPEPMRSLLPIRLIEILPDLAAQPLATAPPAASPKFTADLRAALTNPEFSSKPMRVEAVLAAPIPDQRRYRQELLTRAPGVILEGIVGPLVTFRVTTAEALRSLAALPEVMAVRLPPTATNTVKAPTGSESDALAATNIFELHNRGYRGQGRTLVVIGGGFDRKARGLPANALYLDLTAELSPELEPAPLLPGFDATAAAIAAHQAAPQAALVLVRIDPAAFHQLFTVAKAVLGDLTLSNAQVARAEVLLRTHDDLGRRRDYVTQEYAEAFANLSDDERPRTRREKAQAALAQLKADESVFRVQYDKLQAIRRGLEAVRGAAAVINTLTWDDGYPADGLSEFARFLDEQFQSPRRPTWVQAASESAWSVWAGPGLDRDGDHILEFAGDEVKLPPGTWTRELNFLASQSSSGAVSPEIAAGTKLRIAIQWREPHDPQMPLTVEPLVGFQLHLLRQYDPTGKQLATDEFAEVAVTEGMPVRLMLTPSAGVYEQVLEVTVPTAGRYALRVTMQPFAASRFASQTRLAEIHPKITLRPLTGTDRILFATFMSTHPGVGVPGDAQGAFTVGRADRQGRSLSLLGAGPGIQLRAKPDALLFGDGITGSGSGVAAGTVGGLAACLADLSVRPAQLVGTTAIQPNGLLVLPSEWIRTMPAKP